MCNVVAVVFFVWGSICYIVGLAAPWTYLSFKNAYGDNLGITDEGTSVVPTSVQNQTCSRIKADVYVWKGVCDNESCTGFEDHDAWSNIDNLNEAFSGYYKHAIQTDFAGDNSKWSIVQSCVLGSTVLQLACFALYIYGTIGGNKVCLQKSTKYIAFTLVVTAGLSITAIAVSLRTYALSHQFYTGGGYFVEGWFVYSAFVFGCEGPQYLPGPGIVMQGFGALTMLLLGLIMPCQCMTPPERYRDGDPQYMDDSPVAMAVPILDQQIVYGDA